MAILSDEEKAYINSEYPGVETHHAYMQVLYTCKCKPHCPTTHLSHLRDGKVTTGSATCSLCEAKRLVEDYPESYRISKIDYKK